MTSATARGVSSIGAAAEVQAQSAFVATVNRVQPGASAMAAQSSFIASAREKWENEADTPETWTVLADGSKILRQP